MYTDDMFGGDFFLLALLINEIGEKTGENAVFGYCIGNKRNSFDVAWPCVKVALDANIGAGYTPFARSVSDMLKKRSEAIKLGWIVFDVILDDLDMDGIVETVSNTILARKRNSRQIVIETKNDKGNAQCA